MFAVQCNASAPDSNLVDANSKYVCLPWRGGGGCAVPRIWMLPVMTTRSVRFHQKRRRRRRYPCCALSGARSEAKRQRMRCNIRSKMAANGCKTPRLAA